MLWSLVSCLTRSLPSGLGEPDAACIRLVSTIRLPEWATYVEVLAAFWLPPLGMFLYLALREVGRLRRERKALLLDAEASAAEGYPPPGPPTTDSLSDPSDTLEAPPTEEPR